MKLQLKDDMTYQSVLEKLKEGLPQYGVTLKKNPIARFEFVQVRKGPFVATWVRFFPKKNEVLLVGGIPDFWARLLLGGLLVILFLRKAHKAVEKDVSAVLMKEFGIDKK